MKLHHILFALFSSAIILHAAQTFIIKDVGVSIQVPDNWKHDEEDKFGYVIRVAENENDRRKIRIHSTAYKDISLEKAVQRSTDKIQTIRAEQRQIPEYIISSTPVTTSSGIRGLKAVIGQVGLKDPSYLDRYYFLKPDGKIFCVCVYHYWDSNFSKEVEKVINESLAFTKINVEQGAAANP